MALSPLAWDQGPGVARSQSRTRAALAFSSPKKRESSATKASPSQRMATAAC